MDHGALEAVIAGLVAGSSESAQSIGAKARARFEEIDRGFAARLGAVFGRQGAAEATRRSRDESAGV